MPQYTVFRIRNYKTNMVFRTKCIDGMNSAKIKRVGNCQTTIRTLFHSPDPKAQPNFSLPVSRFFDPTKMACYKGFAIKTFGEYVMYNILISCVIYHCSLSKIDTSNNHSPPCFRSVLIFCGTPCDGHVPFFSHSEMA